MTAFDKLFSIYKLRSSCLQQAGKRRSLWVSNNRVKFKHIFFLAFHITMQ